MIYSTIIEEIQCAGELSPEELEKLLDMMRRVADDKQRTASNAAALEAARKLIQERGQFIPKQPKMVDTTRFSF